MTDSRIRVPADRELLDMACRCCGERAVRLVIDLGDQPQANRLVRPETPIGSEPTYPLRLGYCEGCTLLQIDHTVPRDDMFRDYVYVSGTTETLRRHFAETTRRLVQTYGNGGLVVDIGSNDGTWIKEWRHIANEAVGVEPSDVGAMARKDGVRTYERYFDLETAEHIRSRHGEAKFITSAGSFFHMEDLHGACEGVKRLLAPGGVFVCQAISGADMIHGNAFDQVLHEHLCYYTLRSFSALMEQHGLRVVGLMHHNIHGGSNEYHVMHSDHAPQSLEDDDVELIDCIEFADRVMDMRADLLAVLSDYKARGKSVWAYGAPGKGSTLLNSFGIGPDLVQFAVEKNPRKFGLSIPGCRIPIIPEGGDQPDAYLVLAWNFLDEFIEKERGYLEAAGEFIVPIPNVRIISEPPE